MLHRSRFAAVLATLFFAPYLIVHAEEPAAPEVAAPQATSTDDAAVATPAADAPEPIVEAAPLTKMSKKAKRIEQADSFVAPTNWEFDGFVAGGRDQESKSMFYLNDLVYLNIGKDHGVSTGDRIHFFKKGEKVRDPQNGKLLGFEVRRTAIGQVTDRVDGKTCSVRILKGNEAVEIGDLVRKEE